MKPERNSTQHFNGISDREAQRRADSISRMFREKTQECNKRVVKGDPLHAAQVELCHLLHELTHGFKYKRPVVESMARKFVMELDISTL